jgi:DNA-binding NarL/FixJ family response regulator
VSLAQIEMLPSEARSLTDRIKVGVEAVWELVSTAYQGRAWAALGYSSWDDYCTREFGSARIRLPREERQEVVASLRESGLSIRAIAAATGASVGTVQAVVAGVQNRTPAPEEAKNVAGRIVGTDGKSYRKDSAEPPAFKSVEATLARRERITEMAGAGHHASQIAVEVGMTQESVRNAAREMGVTIAADKVIGRAHRIDPNRVINEAAMALEGAVMGLDLVEWAAVDTDQVEAWADSFSKSLRSLNRFASQLKEKARASA